MGQCLVALADSLSGDEFASRIDRDAALHVLGTAIATWLQSMTKK